MRTNIEIEDKLIQRVMRRGGHLTKRATVDAALRLMDKIQSQSKVLELWGTVKWEGDLEQSRRNRFAE